MVALLLGLALAFQDPEVEVRVDRTEAEVGDELVLTVTVTAPAAQPLALTDPELLGLELRNRRDRTSVTTTAGVRMRVTTREITLRAIRPGTAVVGAIRIERGGDVVETDPLTIRVTAPDADAGASLEPGLRGLVEALPLPALSPEQATIALATTTDTGLVGQQVDLVVTAWIPRDVRARLRAPPLLEPPAVRGAWTYHRPAPSGVVASREVGGVWYDVYVLHDVVFPLTAGSMTIGPARLSYTVPASGAFLSREVRHEFATMPRELPVRAVPASPPSLGYGGATATELSLLVDATATTLAMGDATRVLVELSGYGNVALWPEPAMEWPIGLHAYPQEVRVEIGAVDGVVGGAKTFEYLVVADSAGTHRVPAPRYVYYDVGREAFVTLPSTGLTFRTPGGAGEAQTSGARRPLLRGRGSAAAVRVLALLPLWGWAAVLLFPVLLVTIRRVAPVLRRRLRHARRRAAEPPGTVRGLEAEFRAVLEALVPEATMRDAPVVASALRAAGVEAPLAAHAARVRDRLRLARYGPVGATDSEELAAEADAVLRALTVGIRQRVPSRATVVVLLFLAVAGPGRAQTPEGLYEAGAVRAAADSFARRAEAEPSVAAHWYNLGLAWDRAGEGARAKAAWIRAARLAPRNAAVRDVLERVRRESAVTEAKVLPLTPEEALLGAGVFWLAFWLAIAVRTRRRLAAALGAAMLVLGAYAVDVRRVYREPVVLIAADETPLREAPYGAAARSRVLDVGEVLRVERRWGAWVLVSHRGIRGWVLDREVVDL